MDKYKLHDALIEYTANTMHYFNTVNSDNKPRTAQEINDSASGGIRKYQTDSVYHNQVKSFVANLMSIIDANQSMEPTYKGE